jgi:hypothetical protein
MNNKKVDNLIREINDLVDFEFEDLQAWQDLKKWKLGESRLINGTVNTKIIDKVDRLRFIVQIPPLAEFGKHWHDCNESCTVISGKLKDKLTGKVWEESQQAIFSKGQKHVPCNPSRVQSCFLIMNFFK